MEGKEEGRIFTVNDCFEIFVFLNGQRENWNGPRLVGDMNQEIR